MSGAGVRPLPLLILSDAPSSTSGLGRITRDLAVRVHKHLSDVFRVATIGYGGPGDINLPFMQYHLHSIDDWQVPELRDVWQQFAGDERGVLLTIWDPSRLRWLARPSAVSTLTGAALCPAHLRAWLDARVRPFELWGYVPVDATGPGGRLTAAIKDTLLGYDRLLAYSEWAAGVIEATMADAHGASWAVPALPHGIDTSVWHPTPRAQAKAQFRALGFDGLTDDAFLIGMVATNQPRKDFGLGFETCARLLAQGLNVRVWVHTDAVVRAWNLQALAEDLGLLGRVVITTSRFEDTQMACLYSACDVTLGIGAGEGFGYPIFESLACGTPCVHGQYGGAAEHLSSLWLVKPKRWRLEGQFNCVRPVFDAQDWANNAGIVQNLIGDPQMQLPPALDWQTLWPRWERWFREGAGERERAGVGAGGVR